MSDGEVLYRRLLDDDENYRIDDGVIRPSSQAFADRELRTSVDRRVLCGPTGAAWTQGGAENGVARLSAGAVRGETFDGVVAERGKPKRRVPHKVDVVWRPEATNRAHAQIEPTPEWTSKTVFRKLCERLALLAHFEIAPRGARGRSPACHCCSKAAEHVFLDEAEIRVTNSVVATPRHGHELATRRILSVTVRRREILLFWSVTFGVVSVACAALLPPVLAGAPGVVFVVLIVSWYRRPSGSTVVCRLLTGDHDLLSTTDHGLAVRAARAIAKALAPR